MKLLATVGNSFLKVEKCEVSGEKCLAGLGSYGVGDGRVVYSVKILKVSIWGVFDGVQFAALRKREEVR